MIHFPSTQIRKATSLQENAHVASCPYNRDLLRQSAQEQKLSQFLALLWPLAALHSTPRRLLYLFQAELELSCRACRVAWNRGRSLSTGELMKRGLGLRNEPILWNSVGRLGAKPRVIGPGERTTPPADQMLPTAHRKGFSQGCLQALRLS